MYTYTSTYYMCTHTYAGVVLVENDNGSQAGIEREREM